MKLLLKLCVLAMATASLAAPTAEAGTIYLTGLDGAREEPPNASPGTGFAWLDLDTTAHTLHIRFQFSGLLGTTTAAHIHAPTAAPFSGTAGVATQTPTFVDFPLGVTSGSYDQTFDTSLDSTWNAPYLAANGGTALGAEAALALALAEGKAYLNIHSTFRPGGEIRGFFHPVPEPSSMVMAAIAGLVGLGAVLRGRRRVKAAC